MVLTMAAVAAHKGLQGAGFSVSVRMKPALEDGSGADFETEVALAPSYSRRERCILFNSARACEVHHLLRGPIRFREALQDAPSTRSTAAIRS